MQVIRSLKRALQPAITDVSVNFKVPKEYEVLQSPQNLPPIFNGEKLVVYGIFKSKATTKKPTEYTAILKGNMLGKAQEHKVPFTLDVTEAPSLPVIHHLAAKALITDWESEKKEKKVIVDLSIESSVISSHTAFIAVDEESSEPVSGAMKTYDIQAQMHEERYMAGSALMFASGAKKVKKKGGFMPSLGASLGVRRSLVSAPQKRMASQPMACSMTDESLGSRSLGMNMPPPPPPSGGGGGGGGRGGKGGPPPPPGAMSYAMESAPLLPPAPRAAFAASPKSTSKPTDTLTSLIAAQQVNGSWALNSAFAQLVGKSLSDLESACPIECKGASANVWATVLAVSLLRARYSSQQDEWELIAMKAESWLKKQSLPSGCTLDQLVQAAHHLVS